MPERRPRTTPAPSAADSTPRETAPKDPSASQRADAPRSPRPRPTPAPDAVASQPAPVAPAQKPPRPRRVASPEPPVAGQDTPGVEPVAAGPSTAARGRRVVEAPQARRAEHDVTSPTSGTRGGPPGLKAGPGGQPIATGGGATTSVPTMTGPAGVAPSTEAVGDPGAGSAVQGAQSGAIAGVTAGGALAGPFGAAVAAPVGAVLGSAAGAAEDDMPPPPDPITIPGGGGTGPIDPIYDVARIQRRIAERRGSG
jgi:hypothetical protein